MLAGVLAEFSIRISDVDEDALTTTDPWETAIRLAEAKAQAVLNQNPNAIVIGGDTVVAYEGAEGWVQLSKPTSAAHAEQMLASLSGRTHVVISGYAVLSQEVRIVDAETARVTFRPLHSEEIEAYVKTGEPMDKAGGYGIQSGAAPFLAHLDGNINTVIGLPVAKIQAALAQIAKQK